MEKLLSTLPTEEVFWEVFWEVAHEGTSGSQLTTLPRNPKPRGHSPGLHYLG